MDNEEMRYTNEALKDMKKRNPSIPAQVFHDGNGREVFRYVGFYPETDVLKQLVKPGVE